MNERLIEIDEGSMPFKANTLSTSQLEDKPSQLQSPNVRLQNPDAQNNITNKVVVCIPSKFKAKTTTAISNTSMEWASLPRARLPPTPEYFPVEKFVSDAVSSRHLQVDGNASENKMGAAGYKAILDLLRKRDDIPMLTKVLLALRTSGNGNTMGHICSQRRIHSQLIHLIFRIDPFDPDKVGRVKSVTFEKSNEEEDAQELNADDNSLPDAFLNLVVALVSANSVFLAPTLNALWRLIITAEPALPDGVHLFANEVSIDLTHENGYETDVVTTSTEKQDDDDDGRIQENKKMSECHVRHVQKNSRLHGTLSKILHLVPKGRAEIFPILASSFPFKLSPLSKQMSYVKQCLIVLRYVPTMEQQFLALCMDRCLEIDVEIRIATNLHVNHQRAILYLLSRVPPSSAQKQRVNLLRRCYDLQRHTWRLFLPQRRLEMHESIWATRQRGWV